MQKDPDHITQAYEKVQNSMPSIGFLSRKKRIQGFIDVTKVTEYMITNGEISVQDAMFILSMLMRKLARFQKAATMTAMSLENIGRKVMSPIGVRFAVEARRNLSLPETPHYQDVQPLAEEEVE